MNDFKLAKAEDLPEKMLLSLKQDMRLHQSYTEPGSTKIFYCEPCNNSLFQVGHDDHLTIIRCAVCDREEVVHDG